MMKKIKHESVFILKNFQECFRKTFAMKLGDHEIIEYHPKRTKLDAHFQPKLCDYEIA